MYSSFYISQRESLHQHKFPRVSSKGNKFIFKWKDSTLIAAKERLSSRCLLTYTLQTPERSTTQ